MNKKQKTRIKNFAKSILGVALGIGAAALISSALKPGIYQKIESSAFKVVNEVGGGTAFFVLDPKGRERLISARHVCDALGDTAVLLTDDVPAPVKVKKTAALSDICELELVDPKINVKRTALVMAESDARIFDDVYLGGFPGDQNLTISKGLYSGTQFVQVADKRVNDPMDCLKELKMPYRDFFSYICIASYVLTTTTARAYPGHSGSALLNSSGEVIGIVVATSTPSYNGLAVTHSELLEFLK